MRILVFILLFLTTLCGCSQTKPKSIPPKTPSIKAVEACKEGAERWKENGSSDTLFSFSLTPEVCREGKWAVDEEKKKKREDDLTAARKTYEARERHKSDLWNGLRSRVLTDAELSEVLEIGVDIVPAKDGGVIQVESGVFYGDYKTIMQQRKAVAESVLQQALLLQFKIRLASKN